MSVTASLTTAGLEATISKLTSLAGFDVAELGDEAGAILESSKRGRFDTQTEPDGTPWMAWSEAYDDTREAKHSLLVSEGDFRDSIANFTQGSEVHVGSDQIYAAHHQIGGDEIGSGVPARPYFGISSMDELDLQDLVTGRLSDLMQ
jgi:phage virion morphogenesis protein